MATQLIPIYIMKIYSRRHFIEHFGEKIHTEISSKHGFLCLECKNVIILQERLKRGKLICQIGLLVRITVEKRSVFLDQNVGLPDEQGEM